MAVPDGHGADDVDDSGFVFEGKEGDSCRCWGALAVGDDACCGDAAFGFVGVDLVGGEDVVGGEVGADELGWVSVGCDACGALVGLGLFEVGHVGEVRGVVWGEPWEGVGSFVGDYSC